MPSRPGADSSTPTRPPARRRRIVLLSVLGVIVLLLAATAWVGIRALQAKDELQKAVPLATAVEKNLAEGDSAAAKEASAELTAHARRAASLTSDPIWRLAEAVPWLGANLTAVREAASVTDLVAEHAVAPLTGVAGDFTLASLKPKNGAIDLAPLALAAPKLEAAGGVLTDAKKRVHAIRTRGTIGAVASAVTTLANGVDKASGAVVVAANAARLMPAMLGADGPRNYLLLIQNSAELRATGGVPGAMAIVHTENGHVSLTAQASDLDFRRYAQPIFPLPAETEGLYGTRIGQYIQNTNMTPYFPLTGQLAAAMWQQRFGLAVDGVIKADPVALSYLLKATGPITLATGGRLTSANAVPLLLSEVYQRYADQSTQDAFFASAASAVFGHLTTGAVDSSKLVDALAQAGSERRILLWSAHPAEQAVLAGTTLAGELPVSTASVSRFGVYLNDSTGSKMDYYLRMKVGVASRVCRADGHPNTRVTVTLANTAPADAATALPTFVSGPVPGTAEPGHVRNRVAVYAPKGTLLVSSTSGGAEYPSNAATDRGSAVTLFEVDLAPGQSKTVELDLLQMGSRATKADAVTTPALSTSVYQAVAPSCTSGVK